MSNSLQAVLDKAKTSEKDIQADQNILEKPKQKKTASSKPKSIKAPSRHNKVLIGGHFSPVISRQLKLIAAEEDVTQQQLLEEAINLLFIKKGKAVFGDE